MENCEEICKEIRWRGNTENLYDLVDEPMIHLQPMRRFVRRYVRFLRRFSRR